MLKETMRKKRTWFFLSFIVLFAFIYLNNSSLLLKKSDRKPFLLAHRGLAQTFPMDGITAKTNTARSIYEPEHPYLENTIPSMEAAFNAGADMVEFDVQLTKDNQLAIFHDATLDYRTNGTGSIKDYTMAELKKLDVGFGYTADNGKTYPFRGKGIGLMPSLDEVLNRFPDRSLLINLVSNKQKDGERLAQYLKSTPKARLNQLAAYGGDKPIAILKQKLPDLRVMSKATAKKAFITYMLVGWTGYMPSSIRNSFLYMPQKYARYLWGWPNRFIERMNGSGSLFVIVAGNGKWSEGFDTAEDLKQLPQGYNGGIWTNRIDRIAPLFNDKNDE
jgi:glycerophosphoryl diester phosphodiesterase